MTGALGTLGVVTEAIFRLHPKSQQSRSLTFRTADFAAANALLLRVHDSQLVPTGIQVRAQSSGHCDLDMRIEGIEQGVEAQIAVLRGMTNLPFAEADTQVWGSREALWSGEPAVICKISVLPAQIAEVCHVLISAKLAWSVVAQSVGLVTTRLDGASLQQVIGIRKQIEKLGGSMVILESPSEWKAKFDVWGSSGDSLPLMVRVKQQLDPAGTLNRGRFIGGI